MSTSFSTDREVEELARAFEALQIPPEKFSHAAHIAVALCYLEGAATFEEAARRMREGLERLLAHYRLDGYHETITLFWMRLLAHYRQERTSHPLHAVVNEAVERYGDAQCLFAHFSRELVLSPAARATWVEPDLQPLP